MQKSKKTPLKSKKIIPKTSLPLIGLIKSAYFLTNSQTLYKSLNNATHNFSKVEDLFFLIHLKKMEIALQILKNRNQISNF